MWSHNIKPRSGASPRLRLLPSKSFLADLGKILCLLLGNPLERKPRPVDLKLGAVDVKPGLNGRQVGALVLTSGPLNLKPRLLEVKPRPCGTVALPTGS